MLGAVTSISTTLTTRTHAQQLPTKLTQLCWELMRPFPSKTLILSLWNEREILGTKCRCVAIDFVVDFVTSLGYAR